MRWAIIIMILSVSAMQPAGAGIQDQDSLFPHLSEVSAYLDRLTQSGQSNINLSAATTRGQLLYENHCQECHNSNVHQRNNHRASTPADVKYWISTTCSSSNLRWEPREIQDVLDFVTGTFYEF